MRTERWRAEIGAAGRQGLVRAGLLALGSLALAGEGHAERILDSGGTQTSQLATVSNSQTYGTFFAVKFESPDLPYELTSATLLLGAISVGGSPGLSVSLAENAATGRPSAASTLLGSVAPLEAPTFTPITFAPAAPVLLDPMTPYWLVVTCECRFELGPPLQRVGYEWGTASAPMVSGVPGADALGWYVQAAGEPGRFTAGAGPIYSIQGTLVSTVPEPSHLMWFGLPLVVGLAVRRRRAV